MCNNSSRAEDSLGMRLLLTGSCTHMKPGRDVEFGVAQGIVFCKCLTIVKPQKTTSATIGLVTH